MWGYQAFVCLLIIIFSITGTTGIHDFQSIDQLKPMNMILYLENIMAFDFRMNLLMFIPVGIMIPLLWTNAQKWYRILLCSGVLSLLIELSQMLSFRASDINDIIANTCGGLIGYVFFLLFLRKFDIFCLNDKNKFMTFHSLFQVILIFIVYFLIGAPILSLIHSF